MVSSGIRLQRVGEGGVLQKVSPKWSNFGLCWCGWQTVGSAPDDKSFTCRDQARRVYYAAILKAKKEIPVYANKDFQAQSV
jgi:hypothetical protein